jgi:hypothetical protein
VTGSWRSRSRDQAKSVTRISTSLSPARGAHVTPYGASPPQVLRFFERGIRNVFNEVFCRDS